jgi:hypothetical protein
MAIVIGWPMSEISFISDFGWLILAINNNG